MAVARSGAVAAQLARGLRLGESGVLSQSVHLLRAADPDAVTVLVDRDAGVTFYGRSTASAVTHLDIFHAPGAVRPVVVRGAFAQALGEYRRALHGTCARVAADWFDVQTGVGGGRLSGSLDGGRRPTVLAAHRGHVHLAGLVPAGDLAFCLYLVAEVERRLVEVGCPPRRVERVLASRSGRDGGPGPDLADYAALTDSWLRPQADHGPDIGGAGEERLLLSAADLAADLGGVDALRALLEAMAQPASPAALRHVGGLGLRLRDVLARLVQDGWAETVGPTWALTGAGGALRQLLRTRLREVELAMRQAARRSASGARDGLPLPRPAGPARRPQGAALPPWQAAARGGQLAVAETVVGAARRSCPQGRRLHVTRDDLRLLQRRHVRPVDVCLLLDASASMEGGRMRAAKTLARHLLLTGQDRVAVMAFQERAALLAVPLTRNYAAVERGLGRVTPAGLTPLAEGLRAARCYLAVSHARNPLVLLVTDGIPTVGQTGASPLEDALQEAERLRGSGCVLCCIGLEPNERYLAELAARAGGRLHVVPELRPELLTAVARQERLRRVEEH